jgi:acyl CoA:acetate/3-ketoacid CoA transferase alpha subunit
MSLDKTMTAAAAVAQLRSGMTLGIGGWGPRRKPMLLVREILRSPLRDLTVVSYGGPDVGMLCAAGKVKKLIFAFVTLDAIPLEPYYRKARESGAIEVMELDEGMFEWGLRAAGMRMSFLPIRAGLATDVRCGSTPRCCTSTRATASAIPWCAAPTPSSIICSPAPHSAATSAPKCCTTSLNWMRTRPG